MQILLSHYIYESLKMICVFYMVLCVQSEKLLLFDTVQSELEEKIRRLEEDRHSIDITSGNAHNTHCYCIMFGHACATHFNNTIHINK